MIPWLKVRAYVAVGPEFTVDQDIMANLVAYLSNVDLDKLQKLRVRCVKNVKETNGEIDFEDAFRFQKEITE